MMPSTFCPRKKETKDETKSKRKNRDATCLHIIENANLKFSRILNIIVTFYINKKILTTCLRLSEFCFLKRGFFYFLLHKKILITNILQYLLLRCVGEDLNLHALAGTTTSRLRVYRFSTHAYLLDLYNRSYLL